LPISRKAQREQERENVKLKSKERLEEAPINKLGGQKRKHSDVDAGDPKLREFLEVMQPASKAKAWATQTIGDPTNEPPTKIQAIELPDAESDDEYETVPKKSKRKSSPELPNSIETVPPPSILDDPAASEVIIAEPMAPDATDDDWLRGRTNRLLDLVDPAEITVAQEAPMREHVNPAAGASLDVPESENLEEPPEVEDEWEGIEDDQPDPVIEAIKSNGRLFARNLPYSASEEDLRVHFAPYGTLEEVQGFFLFVSRLLYDEYPDRDSLCFEAYDVNWTRILVDASCFLKGFQPNSSRVTRAIFHYANF
jgi:multiple RNA-binding domain-containing protein 1